MISELDGIPLQITYKQIKRMYIRITRPEGLVKISIPLRLHKRYVQQFLKEKSSWIKEHHDRIKKEAPITSIYVETGSYLPFMGQDYLVIIHEHYGPTQIKIQGQSILCYFMPDLSQEQKQILLDKWYQREMDRCLPPLIDKWASLIKVQPQSYVIKKMKSRWGSCAIHTKRICLNLNLIKKPLICLEYVLVHELIHLIEARHNQHFYALMDHFLPLWKTTHQLLEGARLD